MRKEDTPWDIPGKLTIKHLLLCTAHSWLTAHILLAIIPRLVSVLTLLLEYISRQPAMIFSQPKCYFFLLTWYMRPCWKETLSNLVLIHYPRIPFISCEIRQRYELSWNSYTLFLISSICASLEKKWRNLRTEKLLNEMNQKTALCIPHLTWQMEHFYVYLMPIESFWKRGLQWTTTALKR